MMAIQILGQAKDEVGRLSVRPGKSPPADPRIRETRSVHRALVAVIGYTIRTRVEYVRGRLPTKAARVKDLFS